MDESQSPAPGHPDGAEPTPDSTPGAKLAPDVELAVDTDADAAPVALDTGFPIVGIGASAGGLAAFEAFFSGMPADSDSGMAFVLVQHLSPDHKSILTELVKRYTRMNVYEVEDGVEVRANCAYIIPPNRDMAFVNGALRLFEPSAPRGLRLPIDFFFRSLAQDQHERAICIVLSGTGSDGTLGIRAVKGEGGMVMAQNPESTHYDGMPRSAIGTGLVDYVLPPAEMPRQLIAYVSHAFGPRPRKLAPASPRVDNTLKRTCVILRSQTGHDFSEYKENTLLRRIERRMAVHQIERIEDYVSYLQKSRDEVDALFRDLLIGITSFFRDPEAFAALEGELGPRLLVGKTGDDVVRVWVCGCSTGEEAYSIAILIQEWLDAHRQAVRVQIFATDIDKVAIEQARTGAYPASIAADVSPERLARFFTQGTDGSYYRIQKYIRDMLIFSEQNVIRDPPFSRLDLVSCRNLLIYMNSDLQRRLIPLFGYALNSGGLLFLGSSETVGEFTPGAFAMVDRKWRIYRRQDGTTGMPTPALASGLTSARRDVDRIHTPRTDVNPAERTSYRELTEQALLEHYAQSGLLVTAQGDILHIWGRTGKYLEPTPGDALMNVISMAREGLRRALATALHQAAAGKDAIRYAGLRVRTNGDAITANLTVRRAPAGAGRADRTDLFVVILEEVEAVTPPTGVVGPEGSGATADSDDPRIARLERELRAREEYLQVTIEELETSNEELKSAIEEMQSINEELQSTNEELETSKEELQSVNEELATVNAELSSKVSDLSRANNDMNNLLAGTGVGTLFVDHQLRISRFTPAATQLINLIDTDIGRPVGHIVSNLVGYDRLVSDVRSVLDTLASTEIEVQTNQGRWHLMRIRPYRTLDNVIEGAVITFVDITDRKEMESALRAARLRAENVVDAIREPIVVLDAELRVVSANRAFYLLLGTQPATTIGRGLAELDSNRFDDHALRGLLERAATTGVGFDDYVLPATTPARSGSLRLSARPIADHSDPGLSIVLAISPVPDSPPPTPAVQAQ